MILRPYKNIYEDREDSRRGSFFIHFRNSPMCRSWIRIISITVTLLFTSQQISWAQGGIPSHQVTTSPGHQLSNIAIPRDKAITKEVNLLDSDEIIINIQDAHDSLSAQYSIVDILDTLVKDYNLNIIALEGSSGYIDTSILKTFPIEDIRKETAEDLMKEGELSAGEFFSIVNNQDIELYGIEDNSLYKKHVDSFCENIEQLCTIQGLFLSIESAGFMV